MVGVNIFKVCWIIKESAIVCWWCQRLWVRIWWYSQTLVFAAACIRICLLLYLYLRISFTPLELWPISAILSLASNQHHFFHIALVFSGYIPLKWIGYFLTMISELYNFVISSSPRSPLFSCLGSQATKSPVCISSVAHKIVMDYQ